MPDYVSWKLTKFLYSPVFHKSLQHVGRNSFIVNFVPSPCGKLSGHGDLVLSVMLLATLAIPSSNSIHFCRHHVICTEVCSLFTFLYTPIPNGRLVKIQHDHLTVAQKLLLSQKSDPPPSHSCHRDLN